MITKTLNIDLWQKPSDPISVVRYEASGRKLQIRLTDGGAAVDLTACSVNFYAKKPSEEIVYNACTVVDATAGLVEYVMTEQTVNEAGVLECTITIDKTGESARSQTFAITVTESPDVSGAAESTSEFTALEDALALVSGHESRITEAEDAIAVLEAQSNGWISANETWAYASATTITVPSGAASRYKKGDKIKLTQKTVKYFYVTAVSDTLLTVTGGSDYTLANAAITDNYYSHSANPMGFPTWFNYTPTLGAAGTMTYTSTTVTYAKFMIANDICTVKISIGGTVGGTPSVQLTATTPITPSMTGTVGFGNITDGGTSQAAQVSVISSSRMGIGKYNFSTLTAGAVNYIVECGFYF